MLLNHYSKTSETVKTYILWHKTYICKLWHEVIAETFLYFDDGSKQYTQWLRGILLHCFIPRVNAHQSFWLSQRGKRRTRDWKRFQLFLAEINLSVRGELPLDWRLQKSKLTIIPGSSSGDALLLLLLLLPPCFNSVADEHWYHWDVFSASPSVAEGKLVKDTVWDKAEEQRLSALETEDQDRKVEWRLKQRITSSLPSLNCGDYDEVVLTHSVL